MDEQYQEALESYTKAGGVVGRELKATQREMLERRARQMGVWPQSEITSEGVRPILPPRKPSTGRRDDDEEGDDA